MNGNQFVAKLMMLKIYTLLFGFITSISFAQEIIQFKNGELNLGGELFKPKGDGPFPTVLFNHGSAPGMLNSEASKVIAPLFVAKGWAFFMPYRRGQGLSSKAGKFIGDELASAKKRSEKLVELMTGDHLSDQLAAYAWLKNQKFVIPNQIAVMGNSFGGIQTVLSMAEAKFCAGVDAAGGAESWQQSTDLQLLMKTSVRKSQAPLFFFQAENDYDLTPSKVLAGEMEVSGKVYQSKFYPAFGKTAKDGHSFTYLGSSIWFDDVFLFITKHCQQKK